MRAFSLRIVLVAMTLALAACASTVQRPDGSVAVERQVTHTEYVAAVENVARRRGVRVYWVHAPTKAVRDEQTPRQD